MSRLFRNKKIIIAFLLPALILLAVFIYYPLFSTIIGSFFKWNSYTPDRTFVKLRNYTKILEDKNFWLGLRNNLLYAVISVLFQVGIAMVLAACLEEAFMRKLQGFFRTTLFLPSMISMTVIALLWKQIFNPNNGPLNAIIRSFGIEKVPLWLGDPGLAIFCCIFMSQWQYTGYCMLIDLVGIQKISRELYESAELDGAGAVKRFFYITLPLGKESMLFTSIVTVIGSFKVFTEVQVMTQGGPGHSSEVLATLMYKEAFKMNKMGSASAYAVIIFIITVILSILQMKAGRSGREE